MGKSTVNPRYRVLEKLSQAGYGNEKDILTMQIEDLLNIPRLTVREVKIIIDFRKAIREKRLVECLNDRMKGEM